MARTVPENILKKQARDKVLQDATIKRRAEAKAKRDAKKAVNFYVEPEAKIAFVIRTRGINKLAPKPKKIMHLLRQLHNGVFVRLQRATINMIRMVEPFVTYGYPSRSTVQRLVYKRGCGKINRSRIPLTDNSIVETGLGKFGI